MGKKVSIIGSGFSGLAAATVLAQAKCDVTIFEKNDQAGGRARTFSEAGYHFDMGPSWYWMPDIFEKYFALFDRKPSDYFDLKLLDPGFAVFYAKDDVIELPASLEGIYELFEREESGGADSLKRFLKEAEIKYNLAVMELMYKPSLSLFEFANAAIIKNLPHLDVYNSFSTHMKKFFKSPRLLKLIEFPILFLGASSREIPALYSLMNYAAFNLSTWYPMGGFSKISEAMLAIAQENNVELRLNEPVSHIEVHNGIAKELITPRGSYSLDGVIGASDYHHTENLIGAKYRNYNEKYWSRKTLAPSCLIFYLGINKRIKNLRHHNLFFHEDLDLHSHEIYKDPQWPSKPLFYVCCTSKTDQNVAPIGHENLFILIPVAPDLKDDEEVRNRYYELVISKMQEILGEDFRENIEYKKSYCINDFISDYNSYKGNAYGLANTLRQTAFLRPSVRNKKVKNLFYCGHLTVPGPGVPPALISGQIAARQLLRHL